MASLLLPSQQPSAMCNLKPVSAASQLTLAAGFYSRDESDWIYQCLQQQQSWPDNHYVMSGRRFELPRLQIWHADPGIVYSYSNNLLETRGWSSLLLSIRRRVEMFTGHDFNAVLVNYYRDGMDYVGWHSDDEVEMGPAPVIASLSLGQPRCFQVRPLQGGQEGQGEQEETFLLDAGDLLLMAVGFQSRWQHRVPPQPDVTGGRINLTFRRVLPPAAR